jgi:hypothetical protein
MIGFIRNFLEPFSYLIYSLTLFLEFKKNNSIKEKVLFVYYVFATVVLTYACFIALDYNDDNNWLYNIHYFMTAIVFSIYFNKILVAGIWKFIVNLLFMGALIILFLTDFFLKKTFFNSYGTAFLYICVVTASLIYFRQLLKYISEENILTSFDLWLVSGFVLYFLGSFFIILTYEFFSDRLEFKQRVNLADLWAIQNILLFISSVTSLTSSLWITSQRMSH